MNNLKKYRLGDIVDDVAMGPFGSNLKVDNFIEKGVPVIRGMNLNHGGFTNNSFAFVSEEKANSLKRCLAYPDDLVFTHRGTLGQVAIIPKEQYEKYLVSQSQMRLSVNKNYLIPKFLFYFFKSPLGQKELLKNSSQVGVPAIANPTKSLKEVEVSIPDLKTQEEVASILSSIDEKIILNLQLNKTLDIIIQTIFKEWFFNFNFPGFNGELINGLPNGWNIEPIDKSIAFLNGLALQKYPATDEKEYLPVIKIREMRQGITSSSDKASLNIPTSYIIDNGDVLFSWSGSLDVIIWCDGKGALNQHLFKVSSNKYPKWFYYLWTKHHLQTFQAIAAGKATTMGHIQRKHLTAALINVPSEEILKQADDILSPILDRYIETKIENKILLELKNYLLPKLISGKIEIN